MFDTFTNTQAAADMFKRIVLNLPMPRRRMQHALDAVSRFEGCGWNPHAMQQVVDNVASRKLTLDEFNRLEIADQEMTHDQIVDLVADVLTEYANLMPPHEEELFNTEEAAAFLDMTVDGLKYHVHRAKNLRGINKSGTLLFTRRALERFQSTRREPGRPKQQNV